MAPRETENNAYAKFWGDKQRTLWYVMVFLEWSIHKGATRRLRRDSLRCSRPAHNPSSTRAIVGILIVDLQYLLKALINGNVFQKGR